jgi:hypothetical protein
VVLLHHAEVASEHHILTKRICVIHYKVQSQRFHSHED